MNNNKPLGVFVLGTLGRFFILLIVLSVIWFLLSGYTDKPQLFILGALSVLGVAAMAMRAGMLDKEGVPTKIFPGIIPYMFWLIVEIGKANLIVIKQVFAPKLSPKMIIVPVKQKSDMVKVIYANSVTLTPGTVSVDLQEDCLLVHALTEELADEDAIKDMGDRVCKFDREHGQDDHMQDKKGQS